MQRRLLVFFGGGVGAERKVILPQRDHKEKRKMDAGGKAAGKRCG